MPSWSYSIIIRLCASLHNINPNFCHHMKKNANTNKLDSKCVIGRTFHLEWLCVIRFCPQVYIYTYEPVLQSNHFAIRSIIDCIIQPAERTSVFPRVNFDSPSGQYSALTTFTHINTKQAYLQIWQHYCIHLHHLMY